MVSKFSLLMIRTCIICSGKTHDNISEMLHDNLWIRDSHMEVNVRKSHVMWFNVCSIKGFKSPSVSLNGSHCHKFLHTNIWVSTLMVELSYFILDCVRNGLLFVFNQLSP